MRKEQPWKVRTMDSWEIQRFRSILEIQREQTVRVLDRLEDETRNADSDDAKDVGDLCTTALTKEAMFQRTSERRLMVRMIEAALARIQKGAFGVCVACGDDINPRRLDALPWTQYCLRCQQGFERGRGLEYQDDSADLIALRKAG